jgi:hypothetical protein
VDGRDMEFCALLIRWAVTMDGLFYNTPAFALMLRVVFW